MGVEPEGIPADGKPMHFEGCRAAVMSDEGRARAWSIEHQVLEQPCGIVHVKAWSAADVDVLEAERAVGSTGQGRRTLSGDQDQIHETKVLVDVFQVHGGPGAVMGAGVDAFDRASDAREMHAGFRAGADGEVGSGHVEVAPPCRFVATTVEQEAVDGEVDVRALGPHACAPGIPKGHINEVQRTLRGGKDLDEGIRTGGPGERGGGHLHLTRAVMLEGRACFEQSSAPQGHLRFHIAVDKDSSPTGACSGALQRGGSDVKATLDVDGHPVCDA